jgi:tartrate dehydrogenase/decarboxylase/D-malate dehydrogenase
MFEPVHGSAPDIAGRGVANPMATMLAGAMMLEFLGEDEGGRMMERAVVEVLSDRRELTPDLGGNGTTQRMTGQIVKKLRRVPSG